MSCRLAGINTGRIIARLFRCIVHLKGYSNQDWDKHQLTGRRLWSVMPACGHQHRRHLRLGRMHHLAAQRAPPARRSRVNERHGPLHLHRHGVCIRVHEDHDVRQSCRRRLHPHRLMHGGRAVSVVGGVLLPHFKLVLAGFVIPAQCLRWARRDTSLSPSGSCFF